ncbi:LysM peptidoglycan-binding domain-containing protein [[Clostridium] colinum]|uniref:LysM peptidoglycan-binding domain-containing protein n=1 Tax=[Clostridium] colinum TaxID=36835 RepID=UPI0020241918|nr:LysM peptidoglycan-binding domain-containing protein [[Clostridium] colinum]
MSNKDTKNKNSQQLFSEDITKRLVKKILDDEKENQPDEKSDFNIEYEDYDNNTFDLEEDFDEDEDYNYDEDYDNEDIQPNNSKKLDHKKEPSKKINKSQNNKTKYRKNIEIYGKDFFDDEYDEDYYDESSSSLIGKIISFSIIIVLTISTAFLAVTLISTKKELTKVNLQVKELLNNQVATENKLAEESLKSEIESLKQENERLKTVSAQQATQATTEKATQETSKQTTTSKPNKNTSNTSSSSEYIVKEGDMIWTISKKVYGNGSHFQKILDANGLTENSILKPGQKLIIPKLN